MSDAGSLRLGCGRDVRGAASTCRGEAGGQRLDDTRIAHLDSSGRVFAYEFLAVSRGVSLDGIGTDDLTLMTEGLQRVKRLAVA